MQRARRSGGLLLYSGSRFAAAGTQLVLAVVLTRVLPASDLGRYAAALSASTAIGVFFVSSLRRLTMYRSVTADLSDLKLAALIGGLAAAGVSGLVTECFFVDGRTALMAICLGLIRAADGYAEIAQGAWCQVRAFAPAARRMALRTLSTTGLISVLVLTTDKLLASLLLGALIRWLFAFRETNLARQQPFLAVGLRRLIATLGFGSWVSIAAVAVLLVDTVPTFAVAKYAGFVTAALLAPLGRIRFGMLLLATTVGEIAYPGMAEAANAGKSALRASGRSLLLLGCGFVIVLPVAVLSAPVVFGSLMHGEGSVVALSVVAGGCMGMANLVSMAFTAEARIGAQVVAYLVAASFATLGAWITDWSLVGLYVGQAGGCLGASVILLLARRRPRAGLANRRSAISASL